MQPCSSHGDLAAQPLPPTAPQPPLTLSSPRKRCNSPWKGLCESISTAQGVLQGHPRGAEQEQSNAGSLGAAAHGRDALGWEQERPQQLQKTRLGPSGIAACSPQAFSLAVIPWNPTGASRSSGHTGSLSVWCPWGLVAPGFVWGAQCPAKVSLVPSAQSHPELHAWCQIEL